MDFILSEEEKCIQTLAHKFAQEEMLAHAPQWDAQYLFPVETLKKAAALGFATICINPENSGSGLNRLSSAIIFEELASACPSTSAYLSIHNMVAWMLDHYGNNTLKQKWLPKMATMDVFSSYCLTEPNAGSDAASLKTSASKENDYYILNGAKSFISGGSVSDLYLCMVRTSNDGAKGISCLLIEKGTPGLSFGKKELKLGWHSQPTTMVFFDNCRVPQSNLIGKEGEGFKIALSGLNGGRINIAACSLGGAKQCIQLVKNYLLERKQFQKKLAEFEALQFKFADMLTNLANLLVTNIFI